MMLSVARASSSPAKRDHRRRRWPNPSSLPASYSSRPASEPTVAGPSRRLLPPPRAIGFDLLGGGSDSEGGRGSSSPIVPGSPSPSSSPPSPSPRDLLLASGRLILLRGLVTESSSDSPAVAAAALSLLRAVASPGGRNDGAASSAGAALAAALASRPSDASSGWKGLLLDEVVVGRNNPLARSVARGGGRGGGKGGAQDGGDAAAAATAAAASAAGAALAADLAALQSLAFDGATAASWVRSADPAVPGAWLDAFAAAVDGGETVRREEDGEGISASPSSSSFSSSASAEIPPPPSPRLLPPLTRGQRAEAAAALASNKRWADGAPELISLWSRHGSGNVGTYFAFEWNPSASFSSSLITPCAEDRGGGALSGGEKFGGAAATLWNPVALRLAAWARGDRLSPFDGGTFAARLEVPPSSLKERGIGCGGGGDGDESDDEKDERKKKENKKKRAGDGESSFASSSTSPAPSLSLWDGLRTSPVLLASGVRLVRLPAASSSGGSLPLRSLWRALRLHPRARWVVVSDSFPSFSSAGGGEAALAMEGELPPGVALAVRKR